MKLDELNSRILDAWGRSDGVLLAELYADAGNAFIGMDREDEGCFFLTQAYILALENGLGIAATVREELVRRGREE